MLYTIGTKKEAYAVLERFPALIQNELILGSSLLDDEYGEDRDPYTEGGYFIVVETADDLPAMIEYLDYRVCMCEWAVTLGNSGYLSILYLLNNEFSVMVFMPKDIAPDHILSEVDS